jgi:hypothetical protein
MIIYGSGIADGNSHTHEALPVMLAGKGGGTINAGRHVVAKPGTPITNLYLSLLDRMGAHQESLGDSTARLDQI